MLSAETHRRNPEATAEESYGRFLSNWFRTYDPSLGRYISADPIGQFGALQAEGVSLALTSFRGISGSNVYDYVLNDPANRFDHLGLGEGFVDSVKRWAKDLARAAVDKAAGELLDRFPRAKLIACEEKREDCIRERCSDPATFEQESAKCQSEFADCMSKSGEDILSDEGPTGDPFGVTAPDVGRGDTPNVIDNFARGRGKEVQ